MQGVVGGWWLVGTPKGKVQRVLTLVQLRSMHLISQVSKNSAGGEKTFLSWSNTEIPANCCNSFTTLSA